MLSSSVVACLQEAETPGRRQAPGQDGPRSFSLWLLLLQLPQIQGEAGSRSSQSVLRREHRCPIQL